MMLAAVIVLGAVVVTTILVLAKTMVKVMEMVADEREADENATMELARTLETVVVNASTKTAETIANTTAGAINAVLGPLTAPREVNLPPNMAEYIYGPKKVEEPYVPPWETDDHEQVLVPEEWGPQGDPRG